MPWVYTCLNGGGGVVYVGQTADVDKRIDQHKHTAPWWPEVEDVQRTYFVTSAAACEAEAMLIYCLRPPHNKQHNPTDVPSPPAVGVHDSYRSAVATRLRNLRGGTTREEHRRWLLARGLNVSTQTIWNWENGKVLPSLRSQRAIADAAGIPWFDLFGIDEEVA